MKFFDTDGRCIRDTGDDTEFGWNLASVDVDDQVESFELEDSVKESEQKILVIDPKVPVYGAKSAVECIVNETANKGFKIVSGIISNEALADLIEGDSTEAKTLLSVFRPHKFFRKQTYIASESFSDIAAQTDFASQTKLSGDLLDSLSIDLQHESIDPPCQGSSKNTLSLMAELTLAEAGENMKRSLFGQSTEQDSGIDCGYGFLIQDDEIEDNVKNCDYQTLKLQRDVRNLKQKYKVRFWLF